MSMCTIVCSQSAGSFTLFWIPLAKLEILLIGTGKGWENLIDNWIFYFYFLFY